MIFKFTYRDLYIPALMSLIALFSIETRAQGDNGVVFTAEISKKSLGVNERLKVTFTMNKDGDNFTPPGFENFQVVGGPMQSISTSFINGVKSYKKSYSYTLKPIKMGTFSIGQARIKIDGKTYKTTPVQVTVTKAVENPNAPPTVSDVVDNGVFLVAEVSNTNPYLNEGISVVYKLYKKPDIDINNFDPISRPKYPGFWNQDIKIDNYTFEKATYRGETYDMVVLSKTVLYPQKAGELTIEPLSIDVYARVPVVRRFYGRTYREYASATKRVTAGARKILVKALPVLGQPESFSGAVGQFDFEVTPSKTVLDASESLQIKVKVSGKGNLKLFQLPELVLPSSLEVYEPEQEQEVQALLSGLRGSDTQNYTVIPQFGGRYPIPPLEFSYFDPRTRKYQVIRSKEMSIEVTGEDAGSGAIANASQPRNPVGAEAGNTFHFIRINPSLTRIEKSKFIGSTGFILGLLLPLVSIPLAVWWDRRRREQRSDTALLQRRKAEKLVRKYLSEAKTAMNSKDSFYVALEKALYNFMKARLNLDIVQISKDQVREEFEQRGLGEELTSAFLELLETCERARYSPFSESDMQRDYDRAAELIPRIDKSLRG